MKKIISLAASAVLLSGLSMSAQSFEFDQTKVYAGAGLSYNSFDISNYDNAIGYQFFGGYNLNDDVKLGEGVGLAAEVGYMSSGKFKYEQCSTIVTTVCSSAEFKANGLWVNAVADYKVNDKIKALGRLGFDLGDDDGLMFGIGADYKLDDKKSVRAEYVVRDNITSIQGNFVYLLK